MTLSRTVVVALTALGGVSVAAVLAVRRNERRLVDLQHKAALEVWDNETGSTGTVMAPTGAKLPP